MKTLIITRSLPNSGKSTFCNIFAGKDNTCTADDFFYNLADKSGKRYSDVFDYKLLGEAHKQCKEKCESLMQRGIERIAVANTNCKEKDMQIYIDLAEKYNYTYFCIILEKRHDGDNGHNVPSETIDSMEKSLLQSIKLK